MIIKRYLQTACEATDRVQLNYPNSSFANSAQKIRSLLELAISFIESLEFWIPTLDKLSLIDDREKLRVSFHTFNSLSLYFSKAIEEKIEPIEWLKFTRADQIEEIVSIIEMSCLALSYRILEIVVDCLPYLNEFCNDGKWRKNRNSKEISNLSLGRKFKILTNWQLNENLPQTYPFTQLNSMNTPILWLEEFRQRRHLFSGHRRYPLSLLKSHNKLEVQTSSYSEFNALRFPCQYQVWFNYFLDNQNDCLSSFARNIADVIKYWANQNPPIWIFVSG